MNKKRAEAIGKASLSQDYVSKMQNYQSNGLPKFKVMYESIMSSFTQKGSKWQLLTPLESLTLLYCPSYVQYESRSTPLSLEQLLLIQLSTISHGNQFELLGV